MHCSTPRASVSPVCPLLFSDEALRLVAERGYMHLAVNYTHLVTTYFAYPGTRAARVPENRTMAVQFVQENGYNQVQRPLPQPREGGFGAVKPGN